jgi:PAS domain S-box-containing protein
MAPIVLFMIDQDGMIRFSTGKRLVPLHGSDSSAGHSIYDLYKDTPQVINNFKCALAGETIMDVVTIKGITFETYYEPYYDDSKIKGVVGIGLDVSEHLRTEQSLRDSEERLRLLLNSIRDYAIYTLDVNGLITSWNSGARTIKGYTSDEILNQHFSIFYPQEDRESGLPEKALEIAKNTGHYAVEGWRMRKDGTRYWASVAITPLLDKDGTLRGFSKVARDITLRKQMEEALRESEARFRTIFEGATIGIELIDMQGRLLTFNPAICKIFGYEGSELRQEALLKDNHPVNVLANLWQFKEMQAGSREWFNLDKPFQHKDGHWIWGRLSATLVRDMEGDTIYVVAMIEDINERHQMEIELAELQRRLMEGREAERLHLAQELHDGPVQELYGVSYTLNALSESLPGEGNGRALIDLQHNVQQVVQRLRSMSSDLRPPTLVPFGLEKAIRSHAQQFQEEHPELTLHLELMPDGQSLPERARLALFRIYQASLANVLRHAQATHVAVRYTQDAEEVVLEIEDDGRGFRTPSRWITLARQGHLGLVGAMERAESIGGKFDVWSEPSRGTRVRVVVSLTELSKLASDEL